MAHTYTNLLTHIIFSTKNRIPAINDELKPRLFSYIGGIVRKSGGEAHLTNGTDDHVHTLVRLPPTIAVADAVRLIKSNSSGWVHKTWPKHGSFAWQVGYGAFSVSVSKRDAVMKYITRQEEHHRRVPFKEEFIAFLKKHNIEYDEERIWD